MDPEPSRPTETAARPLIDAAEVLASAPDGLAVVTSEGVFVQVNEAGARLFTSAPERLAGTLCPFPVPMDDDATPGRRVEQVVTWEPVPGTAREFDVVCSRIRGRDLWAVSFRDVTESRRTGQRLSALAAAAAGVAAKRSLSSTLEALAQEILRTDGIAAVQVLTLNPAGDRFQVMGTAGFDRTPDFFDRLLECAARGARLAMLKAFAERRPVVVPHRYAVIMSDPAWVPLREVMATPRWDGFVSVPLVTRSAPVGILNVFFAEDQPTGDTEVEFLTAMAEQAAMAVEHADLLERDGEVARREERQRLAHDLHDSVVQQVFSINMLAKSLGVLSRRTVPPPAETVARVADELGDVAQAVLADLRAMVVELRPVTFADRDLGALLRSLADVTTARTGIQVLVDVHDCDEVVSGLDPDLLQDAYRVIAEAVHNAVKHAAPQRIAIDVALDENGHRLTAEVVDDGRGLPPPVDGPGAAAGPSGYGMTTMRERAARWSGKVTVGPGPQPGTRMSLVIPLPSTIPVIEEPHWTTIR